MRLLNHTSFLVGFFFFSSISFLNVTKIESKRNTTKIPAVIVFGDSIVDPGNNNYIKTIIKCNFPPYGANFPDHKPTGRFCNGKIPSDLIASILGIKEYVPPYVGVELPPEELLTGVSFASGGSGYDPLTSKVASVLSMDQQLVLFQEYKAKVMAIAGSERGAAIISDSLYVVVAGSDDVANTYFPTPFRKTMYDIPSYADLIKGYVSKFVQELISLGAKKVALVSIPPIGCVPSQRTLAGGIVRDCAPRHNQLAKLINSNLKLEFNRLQPEYPGTQLILVDIFDFLLDMILRPTKYGFQISNKGCCGTGKLEVSVLCNSLSSKICDDVSKYLFWDSYHPTEKAYKVLVDFIQQNYLSLLM